MKRGQKGFGAVEGLLIIIIILLVGFIGYYVWNSRNNADRSLASATKDSASTPATPVKKTTTSTPAQSIETTAASSLVQDFYTKYYQAAGGSNPDATPDRDQMKQLVQQDGTANLINTYNNAQAFDPISCGQDIAAFTVKSSTASDSKAVVAVQEAFTSGPVDFTVDVVNSGGLKIDTVNCPPPPQG